MAREINRLSAKAAEKKRIAGYYADGAGLYLQVSPSKSKSWIFRFMRNGKEREMGLGSLLDVPLAEAREQRDHQRKLLRAGIDPIEARQSERARRTVEAAKSITFSECATAFIKAHRAGWKNAKHADQWANTIETYCGPVFGSMAVGSIDTALVLRALEPIWTSKPETASRVRARIEHVLDWARVRGYRTGDNPARLRGHLDKLLPKMEKRKRVKHHPALPYRAIGEFLVELRKQPGIAARALDFTILTAARTNEVIGARWREIDLDAGVWTIPAERMKAHREHRVPLSTQAVKLLRQLPDELVEDAYVFSGQRARQPLSNMAMLALLQRMGRDDLTVHGFRSTFRDWTAECTSYPREVCEMALAHVVSDQVEAAYRRGDLFDRRRRLTNDWARYCGTAGKTADVLPLRRRARAT